MTIHVHIGEVPQSYLESQSSIGLICWGIFLARYCATCSTPLSLTALCLIVDTAAAVTELRLTCLTSVWMVLDCREIKSDSVKVQRELKIFITACARTRTQTHTLLFLYLFSACKRASSSSADGVGGQIFNESVANGWASSRGAKSQKSLVLDGRNDKVN